MASRRGFIKSGALAVLGISAGSIPAFIARAAGSLKCIQPYKKHKVLICIFQRGAMDGLMAVSPFTDTYLQAARPQLFIPATKDGKSAPLIDLDGRFGLHPGMKPLEKLFRNKQLAIVHGTGSPNNSRSHFDAQDFMESGIPFDKGALSGWLNRASGLLDHEASPFRSVSFTNSMPRSFYGYNPAIAIQNLQDFAIGGRGAVQGVNIAARSFEDLYDQTTAGLLKDTGKETFEAVKMLEKINTGKYLPENGSVYPATPLGNALKQIAQMIKSDVGLEIGFAESTGWDTHYKQGTENGVFARSAMDLASCLDAFWTDLGDTWQDEVTIMTMTEFGRTVKQNGSGGTDHGRGSCNFILGNNVQGGLVHGVVQPLAVENLEDGRDLAVTTDFRAVFSEVADKHLKIHNDAVLFPGWNGSHINLLRT